MPTNTYTPLANVTLSGSDASINFVSIPNTYRDLVLVINGNTTGNADFGLRFNGDGNANYSFVYMGGNGSGSGVSGASSSETQIVLDAYFWRTSERGTVVAQIMDYSATDKHKTVLSRNNLAGAGVDAFANRWANTAAINAIEVRISTAGQSFATGTTFSLYGVIA
jgi:hypothetical protein